MARFDLGALSGAVDGERRRRVLTWGRVSEELGVSTSTIRRLAVADDAEADGVLALVRWLGVEPEHFVVGGSTGGAVLDRHGPGFVRVDREALATAAGDPGGARGRTRTSIQRLVEVATGSGRTVASLTRSVDS